MKYFIIYLIGITVIMFLIDWLQNLIFKKVQWSRKVTHVVTGLIAFTFPMLLNKWQIIVLTACFLIMMGISKIKNILSLHNVSRKTWGEVLFPLSVGITAFICLPEYTKAYYTAILCLALADTIANLIGTILPIRKIKIGTHTKSVGGFLSCTIVVFAIFSSIYPLQGQTILFILAAAIIISTAELISVYGTDNITVPVVASFACIIGEKYFMIL